MGFEIKVMRSIADNIVFKYKHVYMGHVMTEYSVTHKNKMSRAEREAIVYFLGGRIPWNDRNTSTRVVMPNIGSFSYRVKAGPTIFTDYKVAFKTIKLAYSMMAKTDSELESLSRFLNGKLAWSR